MKQERAADAIARLIAERAKRSDEEIIAELKKLEPLPAESEWNDSLWGRAQLFVALGDLAAKRKLRAAAPLLLERASLGDPGEMMRGLRHTLEAIFKPDWDALAAVCLARLQSKSPGARLWALDQLAVLRDQDSLEPILARLTDEHAEVREFARQAVVMLCDGDERLAPAAIKALKVANARFPGEADDALKDLER